MKTDSWMMRLRKNRKKILLLYLGWCLLRGLLFLFLGFRLLG